QRLAQVVQDENSALAIAFVKDRRGKTNDRLEGTLDLIVLHVEIKRRNKNRLPIQGHRLREVISVRFGLEVFVRHDRRVAVVVIDSNPLLPAGVQVANLVVDSAAAAQKDIFRFQVLLAGRPSGNIAAKNRLIGQIKKVGAHRVDFRVNDLGLQIDEV